jgi:CubicO group peptidase (beta-lactamase class C family)
MADGTPADLADGWRVAVPESVGLDGALLRQIGPQWWLGRSLIAREEITWISGVGYGGQRLYIVPSRGLVIVVHAGLYDSTLFHGIVGEVVLRRYALSSVRM